MPSRTPRGKHVQLDHGWTLDGCGSCCRFARSKRFAAVPYYANGSHDAAFRVDSRGVGIMAGAMESFRALDQAPLARQAWALAQKRTPFQWRADGSGWQSREPLQFDLAQNARFGRSAKLSYELCAYQFSLTYNIFAGAYCFASSEEIRNGDQARSEAQIACGLTPSRKCAAEVACPTPLIWRAHCRIRRARA